MSTSLSEELAGLDAPARARLCQQRINDHKACLDARNHAWTEIYKSGGVSHADIAAQFGVSETTVRIAIQRCQARVASAALRS
jgi:hypothetical protein